MNKNPTLSSQYQLFIPELPEVNYFIQRTTLPGTRIQPANNMMQVMNRQVRIAGDTLQQDPLSFDFIVDEDLANWYALYQWMKQDFEHSTPGNFKEVKLHLNTRNHTPNLLFTFYNVIMNDLGALSLDSTLGDAEVIVCTALLQYSHYEMRKL